SQFVMPLNPFSLSECREFLGSRYVDQELMDAYLSLGGVPEYLKYIKGTGSVFESLCQNSFKKSAFFLDEYEKIFISSLASNKYYKQIIELLAHRKTMSRNEIAKSLKLRAGGTLSELLRDLELCGFIEKLTPYNLTEGSSLNRYVIADNYLQFYFKFILTLKSRILKNDFDKNPMRAINLDQYRKWLGFAFERWCRNNSYLIAGILGFSAVEYQAGAYFTRNHPDINAQIDLLFARKDRTLTVCEIKYQQAPVAKSVVADFEHKLQCLKIEKNKTIQKVLITASAPEPSLLRMHYFDRIITLEDLCQPQ
ncbi:MAG: hypothetical protein ABL927_09565, partial [Bdellovibrionales bacterium]